MRQEEIYRQHEGKTVDVGIPHYNNPNKLFFITGKLIEVNDQYILLETSKGIRRLSLVDILQFEPKED